MSEFLALSAKVAEKTATDEERARWRELRSQLSAAPSAPPPPPGGKERAHPRSGHKLRVHYAALADMQVTFTDEVGGGGLRLRANRHLEPGTPLVLRLDAAGLEPITVEARVVWSRREGGHFAVGVEFIDLPPAHAERLDALMQGKP